MNTVIQSLDSPAPHRKNTAAIYCLTCLAISLVGLTGVAGYQLIELIPLKATVLQQSRELAVDAVRIKKLAEEKKELSIQHKQLEAELQAAKQKSDEAEARVLELQNRKLSESPVSAKSDDGLCAIIKENIRQVEAQLNRDDFFRLRDEREAEAEAVLEAYKNRLDECLSQATSRRDEGDDAHQLPETQGAVISK